MSKGQIQTLTDLIAPSAISRTLMHEHILLAFSLVTHPLKDSMYPEDDKLRMELADQDPCLENLTFTRYFPYSHSANLSIESVETATKEVARVKAAEAQEREKNGADSLKGDYCIVDLTTLGIRVEKQGAKMAEVSKATGVPVVGGAGFYFESSLPDWAKKLSEDKMTEMIVGEIRQGMLEDVKLDANGDVVEFIFGTAKCGIIGEVGCIHPLTEVEKRSLRASARAQKETGASISIRGLLLSLLLSSWINSHRLHLLTDPGRSPQSAFDILDVLRSAGADVSRVIMGHLETRNFDFEACLAIAKTGCILEFDLFGTENSYW
jgi:phosphotriesterase-related protein